MEGGKHSLGSNHGLGIRVVSSCDAPVPLLPLTEAVQTVMTKSPELAIHNAPRNKKMEKEHLCLTWRLANVVLFCVVLFCVLVLGIFLKSEIQPARNKSLSGRQ